MMDMVNGVIAGVGAGLGANYGQKKLDQPKPDFFNEIAWFERWEESHAVLHRIEAHVKALADAHKPDQPKTQIIVLHPGLGSFIRYQTYGKQYTLMFAGAAVQVVFNVPGIGNVTMNLNVGWNIINLPDGTQIGLPSTATNSVNLLYRASDVMYGSAI